MTKVRDLGINVIPATMRPLEIGPGAVVAGKAHQIIACGGTSNCIACACNNTDFPATSCDPSGFWFKDQRETSRFHPEAVLQLQQQLRARISDH